MIAALPFAQAGMLLRREFSDGPLATITSGVPEEAADSLRAMYGLDLYIGDWSVPAWFVLAVLVTITIVCAALSSRRIRRRIR